MIIEGSFVMGMTSEGVVHGMVEHIMVEGGTYGVPGTEYAIQSMPPRSSIISATWHGLPVPLGPIDALTKTFLLINTSSPVRSWKSLASPMRWIKQITPTAQATSNGTKAEPAP